MSDLMKYTEFKEYFQWGLNYKKEKVFWPKFRIRLFWREIAKRQRATEKWINKLMSHGTGWKRER